VSPRSSLEGCAWQVPGVGSVQLANPRPEVLCELDDEWAPLRFVSDWHHVWRWSTICHRKDERFVLLLEGRPVAIWCCDRGEPLKLPGGRMYHLSYVEVRSDLRGGLLSTFLFGVVAARAIECGAVGVIMSALPIDGLVETYVRLGARRGAPRGWTPPRKLVPLTIDEANLRELKDIADGLLQERSGRG
jgi:hypothetical protein